MDFVWHGPIELVSENSSNGPSRTSLIEIFHGERRTMTPLHEEKRGYEAIREDCLKTCSLEPNGSTT